MHLTGFFASSAVDYGGGPLPFAGVHDVMLVTLDLDGNHVRSRGFGGSSFDEGHSVTASSEGMIYLAGRAHSGAQFGGADLTGPAGANAFVASFTADGDPLASLMFGGPGDDGVADLGVDAAGNVYLGGTFEQTAFLGGSSAETAAGASDGFVTSFTAAGVHRWQRTVSGTGSDRLRSMVVSPDGSIVYVAGVFTGTLDLGIASLTAVGGDDAILLALDAATGALLHYVTWGSSESDGCNGLAVDGDGNVYGAGFFSDSIVLDGTPYTSAGAEDLLLFSMTPVLETRWATVHGGPGRDRAIRIAASQTGVLAAAGVFEADARFGDKILSSAGIDDGFVMATGLDGAPLWSFRAGGSDDDNLQSVAIDEAGSVYVTGSFNGTIDVGPQRLDSAGGLDALMFRLDIER